MKRFVTSLCALALAAVLLPGCSSKKEELPACPATGMVRGAAAYPVITGDAEHTAWGDLAAMGTLRSVQGYCSFKHYERDHQVDLELTLNFAGQRGPKGGNLKGAEFPYFVAVLSPDDQILQRQEFSTSVDFDKAGLGVSSEDYSIHIPVSVKTAAPGYKVAVGFRLTPRQAEYNKENHAD